MQSTPSPQQQNEIISIVLAGSSNLHLWPVSRINEPAQFQKQGNALSPFQQSLQLADSIEGTTSTFATVSAPCINLAREQISELNLNNHLHLIVEPVERGDLCGLLATLIIAAGSNRNACAIVLDANQPPTDWAGFRRLLDQLQNNRMWEQHPVLCCAQTHGADQSTPAMRIGEALGHDHLFRLPGSDARRKHWVNANPAMILLTPRLGLQMIRRLMPGTLNTMSAAVQASQEMNGCTWPDMNLWSALPQTGLADALMQQECSALIRPVDFIAQSKFNASNDQNFEIIDNGHLIVISQCPDIEIITTPDATLVRSGNHPFDATKIIEALRNDNRPELTEQKTRFHPWGRETEQERGGGFLISWLEIDPGCAMNTHFHNHRTETWNVLHGNGDVVLDQEEFRLDQGSSLTIPRCAVHSLANPGSTPLVVLEIRHGAFLSSVDHIRTTARQAAQFSVV